MKGLLSPYAKRRDGGWVGGVFVGLVGGFGGFLGFVTSLVSVVWLLALCFPSWSFWESV